MFLNFVGSLEYSLFQGETVLTVGEVKKWVDRLRETHNEISGFTTKEPIGNILKKLEVSIEKVENYVVNIGFCGRPRMGKSYMTNCIVANGFLPEEDLGKYPCPTASGLQPATRIPVKFVYSESNTLRFSVNVCSFPEYKERVRYELKEENMSIESFELTKEFKLVPNVSPENQRIFEWMTKKFQIDALYVLS